jgi:hypothetical protein
LFKVPFLIETLLCGSSSHSYAGIYELNPLRILVERDTINNISVPNLSYSSRRPYSKTRNNLLIQFCYNDITVIPSNNNDNDFTVDRVGNDEQTNTVIKQLIIQQLDNEDPIGFVGLISLIFLENHNIDLLKKFLTFEKFKTTLRKNSFIFLKTLLNMGIDPTIFEQFLEIQCCNTFDNYESRCMHKECSKAWHHLYLINNKLLGGILKEFNNKIILLRVQPSLPQEKNYSEKKAALTSENKYPLTQESLLQQKNDPEEKTVITSENKYPFFLKIALGIAGTVLSFMTILLLKRGIYMYST